MARPKEDFADWLRRVRSAAGLSTRQVAERSGGLISHGYVSQIENRQVAPDGISPRCLLGLARGTGVSIDEVLANALDLPRGELASEQVRLIGFFNTLPEDKQREAVMHLEGLSRMYGMRTKTIRAARQQKARRTA